MRPSRLTLLATFAAVLVAAAGCVSPSQTADTATAGASSVASDWHLGAIPSSLTDPKHDHDDPAQHQNLTTPNFRALGYDPLVTAHYGTTLTGMGCGGVGTTTDERRIAVVHSISTDVAFVVADVTDPEAPFMLGEYLMPNVVVWDATVTPDGLHALVGAYPPIFGDPTPVLPPVPPADGGALLEAPKTFKVQPMWRDACTGETRAAGPEQYLPFGPGIVMVGLQDPTNPTFEDWVSQPVIGPHSVSSSEVDGTIFATSSVTNLVHEVSYYTIFTVETLPTGAGKLAPYTVIQAPGVASPALNGHTDVEIQKHPVTGQILAYLANWDQGMTIYDISLPGPAVEVSTWMDGEMGAMHSTRPQAVLWGDRHITLAGQEVGEPVDLPSGWIYILDTTDPANPVELSRWTIPVKPKWDGGGLQFSTHYMDLAGMTMFVTNYHGGMWAVDVSDLTNPQTVGLFVPDRTSPSPFGGGSYGPGVEDVVVGPDGVLTVWDNAGGVYNVAFDPAFPMPDIPEWAGVGGAAEDTEA